MALSTAKAINPRPGFDYIGVSVCVIIHDGKGKILLMKRSDNARDEHGRWDICGGALDYGETIEASLRREVREELCSEVQDIQFLTALDVHREYREEKTHWVVLLHAAVVHLDMVKIGEPHKFDEFGWFNTKTLPSPVHSQFSKALQIASAMQLIS